MFFICTNNIKLVQLKILLAVCNYTFKYVTHENVFMCSHLNNKHNIYHTPENYKVALHSHILVHPKIVTTFRFIITW